MRAPAFVPAAPRLARPGGACRACGGAGPPRRIRAARPPRACAVAPGAAPPPADATPEPAAAREPAAAPPKDFQYVGWADVERMCAALAARLRGGDFDAVLAVTRGGMVPATMLAQALELRNVLSATVIFYTDSGETFFGMAEPRFLSFPGAADLAGRRVLVVDDVWDSGRTAVAVRRRVERAGPAAVSVSVLHYKPALSAVDARPDHYAEVTDRWVVYPWERASPHHAQ